MRNILVAFIVILASALGGCGQDDERAVEVQVRVRLCTSQGQACFALPVPDADVQIRAAGNDAVLANGKTDEAGKLSLTLDVGAGVLQVTATSPVFQGGKAEANTQFPDAVTSILLDGPITTEISPS